MGDSKLSPRAREQFLKPENEFYLSVISEWEIVLKYSLKNLILSESPEILLPSERKKHGILPLPLSEEATLYLHRLPSLHRDPFDRMLICQAIAEKLTLITPDHEISQYPVPTVW